MDFKSTILLFIVAGLSYGIPVSPPRSHTSPTTKKHVSDPEPCCVPTSHGNVSVVIAAIPSGGSPLTFSSLATIAFDNENPKIAVHGVVTDPTNPSNTVSVILDYSSGQIYITMPQTKQCLKKQFPAGYMGTCIPYDFYTYMGQANLGWDTSANTAANMWQIDASEVGLNVQFSAWTTPKECGMVKLSFWGSSQDNDQITATLNMYNMTMGVKDPSVFNVPTYCNGGGKSKGPDEVLVLAPPKALKYKSSPMGKNLHGRM